MKTISDFNYRQLRLSKKTYRAVRKLDAARLFVSMFYCGKIKYLPKIGKLKSLEIENALREKGFLPDKSVIVKDNINFLCTALEMDQRQLYVKYNILAKHNNSSTILQFYNTIHAAKIFDFEWPKIDRVFYTNKDSDQLIQLFRNVLSNQEFAILYDHFGFYPKIDTIAADYTKILFTDGISKINQIVERALHKLRTAPEIEEWYFRNADFCKILKDKIIATKADPIFAKYKYLLSIRKLFL